MCLMYCIGMFDDTVLNVVKCMNCIDDLNDVSDTGNNNAE